MAQKSSVLSDCMFSCISLLLPINVISFGSMLTKHKQLKIEPIVSNECQTNSWTHQLDTLRPLYDALPNNISRNSKTPKYVTTHTKDILHKFSYTSRRSNTIYMYVICMFVRLKIYLFAVCVCILSCTMLR